MPAKPVVPDAGFDFTSFQAIRPTTPLPGNSIDAENAQLRQTQRETIDWVASVVGTDGTLGNATVDVDALAVDVIALIGASSASSGGPFAPAVHNHDALYSPIGHTHPGGGGTVDTAAILAQALTAAQAEDVTSSAADLAAAQAADAVLQTAINALQTSSAGAGASITALQATDTAQAATLTTVQADVDALQLYSSKVVGAALPNAGPVLPTLNVAGLVDGGVGFISVNYTAAFDSNNYTTTFGGAHSTSWINVSSNGASVMPATLNLFIIELTTNAPAQTDAFSRVHFKMAGVLA